MASLNKVVLIGYLTADPELRQTNTGTNVTSFSIGVQRRFTKNEGAQTTDFINCVAWRQQAEFITRYFKKGRPICVCGALQSRSWTDQQGSKRYATEVVVDEVSFVDSKSDSDSASGSSYVPGAYGTPAYQNGGTDNTVPKFEEVADDDSLPF